MTAWSHLPNAKYIDLILADLKKHPDDWSYTVVKGNGHNVVRNAARDVAKNVAWDAAKNAAYYAAKNDAYYTARYAILALIAYDDCSWILNEKPEYIQLLAALTQEPQYILLYPAVSVLEKSKEIS